MNNIKIFSKKLPLIYLQTINERDNNSEYVSWLNDPNVNQYLETRFQEQTLSSVLEFIRKMVSNPHEHLFTIRLKKDNKHIGNIKIGRINIQHNIGDISLFIGDKNFWGKGIATQAIQLISRYSIEYLQLRKLSAGAYQTNISSTKAFLAAGYKQDCILKNHYIYNDNPCNLVQCCLFEHQVNTLPAIEVRYLDNNL